MAPWKQIFLKALGVGVGIGLVIAIAVGVLAWRASRPVPEKPWDANAITATFYRVSAVDTDRHLQFIYILENHTDRDFQASTNLLRGTAVIRTNDSLVGGSKLLKFTEDEIFLPAKQHADFRVELPRYIYPKSMSDDSPAGRKKYEEDVKKFVAETIPQLNGFAVFDDANRYRINLPNGWSQ